MCVVSWLAIKRNRNTKIRSKYPRQICQDPLSCLKLSNTDF